MTTEFLSHARYFKLLERDLIDLGEYVELVAANESVYSIRMVRLMLLTGSEIDAVAKAIYLPKKKNPTIVDHQQEIMRMEGGAITTRQCYLFRSDIRSCPWAAWQVPSNPPDWWTAHNKVKHDRQKNYVQANLRNAVSALFGLFQLLRIYATRANVMFEYWYKNSGYRLVCDRDWGNVVPQF